MNPSGREVAMVKQTGCLLTIPAAVLALVLTVGLLRAQEPPGEQKSDVSKGTPAQQEPKPITEGLPQRDLSPKEREKREKALRKELESHFRKWLEEDAVYIIIPEEKEAFLHLNSDEEREQFIEQFWLRRDPVPDTIENEYKEEHYRRIAYSNERFTSGMQGWQTDRGRIYIAFGPPDEIETHAMGGGYWRRPEEGGGQTSTYPFERWFYRHIEGVGGGIELEFVDPTMSGEYRLSIDPSEKDALTIIPGAGLSALEDMGLAHKSERFMRMDGTRLPARRSSDPVTDQSKALERLQRHAAMMRSPEVKFKDLEALVTTRISFNLLPFDVRVDFLRITDESVLAPITVSLQTNNVAFQLKGGVHSSVVNVFGRVTTLTGRIVQTFEDVIQLDVPPDLLAATLEQRAVYQKAVPLRPGLYKLNLVLKDLNSGNIGTMEERLAVPRFEENQLAHSSLILTDRMERVAAKNVGSGQFVIGDFKLRPAVREQFQPNQRMGIYLQVYNLGINETTHKPNATIEYTIVRGKQTVFRKTETTGEIERAGQQMTLAKLLRLGDFGPGDYTLTIKITDHVRSQSLSPTAQFRIR